MRCFYRDLCYQMLGDEVLAAAYMCTYPDCWPLLYALDVCWTLQYVKSLR